MQPSSPLSYHQRCFVKAGITGHRDLGGDDITSWVQNQLERTIDDLGVTAGLTSLAIGADQLFADILQKRRIPFTAVIPSEHYETTFTFDERAHYDLLRGQAISVVQLPYSEPSEAAYMAAGKEIVDGADLVVAVWNGKPARGHGGTADVVNYALTLSRRVVHINPESRSLLEL